MDRERRVDQESRVDESHVCAETSHVDREARVDQESRMGRDTTFGPNCPRHLGTDRDVHVWTEKVVPRGQKDARPSGNGMDGGGRGR